MALGSTQLPSIIPGDKGDQCVQMTTLPRSCDYCLEIWELQTPGTLQDLYMDWFTFFYILRLSLRA
jgi:hypothetical protein